MFSFKRLRCFLERFREFGHAWINLFFFFKIPDLSVAYQKNHYSIVLIYFLNTFFKSPSYIVPNIRHVKFFILCEIYKKNMLEMDFITLFSNVTWLNRNIYCSKLNNQPTFIWHKLIKFSKLSFVRSCKVETQPSRAQIWNLFYDRSAAL